MAGKLLQLTNFGISYVCIEPIKVYFLNLKLLALRFWSIPDCIRFADFDLCGEDTFDYNMESNKAYYFQPARRCLNQENKFRP